MLQDIREHTQGVIAKIIIGLIVAIFALFGVESIIGGFITSPPVAEVNGEEITEVQLQTSTQNLLNSIGGAIDSLDPDLVEQIALNQLIEETLMRQAAENADMAISSDQIDLRIIQTEQFQLGGVFDADLAVRTMASQGFNVPLYRESLRGSMILSQLANGYSSSNFVTRSELQRMAALTEQTRDFRYLSITLGTRTLGTPISDEEIANYYNANQAQFAEDESVGVRYVLLDQAIISREIELDEAEILAQYEQEREDFEGNSEKRASHILFEVGGDLNEDQAMELALAAQERLLNGEEFEALAMELSHDTISGEDGGDIGYSDGTAFPEEIEAALEIMAVDEISDPVVSEFGVHLVKLTEDSRNVYQSYEEVADRIERELKSSEVEQIYASRLEDLSNLAFETGDLVTIAEELDLDILESQPFGRDGGNGIFTNPAVVAAAFSDEVLLEGNNSDVIELGPTQAVVVRVSEFNEASILPLEEVEAEIAVLLRTEMEREAVQTLGEEILVAAETGGETLDQLLQENELEWLEQEAADRNSFTVNREILDEVFSMPSPEAGTERSSITLANGTFVMIELNQVNSGDYDALEEADRIAMAEAIHTSYGNSDFESYILSSRERADIQAMEISEQF